MPRNGSGTMSLATPQQVPGNPITAVALWNTTLNDIATQITNSIPRDGQAPPTANLPMNSFKFTGLGDGLLAADSATLGQVQSGASNVLSAVAGADAITANATPAPSAYAAGQTFRFVSVGANTTVVTLNVNGLGAKSVTKNGATPLAPNDIPSGAVVEVMYDGTQFQVIVLNLSDAAIASYNAADPTKRARFSLTNLTTATTRVMTVPDANITLTDRALTQSYAPASGTNAYTTGMGPQLTAYVTNGIYFIKFANANTISGCTLNIDGIGNVNIVRQGGAALYVGDISAGMYAILQYSGTQFILLNPAVPAPLRYVSSNQDITAAAATTLTLPHSLPGTPKRLWFSLLNVSTEYGWNGEELFFTFGSQDNTSAVARGAMAWSDATNVYVLLAKGNPTFNIMQKTTDPGGQAAATNAKWRMKVYAEL